MKKAILFVDDDTSIIHGLKRLMRIMRYEWDMFFAESGQEALSILALNRIDIIVADMRMPEMDGLELLNKVKKLYPHVIRIIFSGHFDHEMTLHSLKIAHQCLAKPCSANTLQNTIERTCSFKVL